MITLQRWTKPIQTSFKRIATSYAQRLQSGNTKNLKRALLLTCCLSATILAFSLFSASTIFSFSLMITTFLCFVGLNFYEVWKKGIVYCLSSNLQNILLHRSLFDMICDIWFIPDIVLYFRVLLLPFFVQIEPSAAIHQFHELSPAAQKFFLQKGLVHLLPEYIKNAIVPSQIPSSENLQEHHNGVFHASSSQNDRQEQIIEKKEAISNSQSHSRNNKFLRKRPQQIISTRHRNKKNEENPSRQNQSAFSDKWDYLEMFLTKKREENLIKKHLPPEPPKKLEFKDYFKVLERFTIFLSKEKFFEKVNSRKLSTVFLISTCSVIAQLYFSKRTRKWCFFTLKILAYIIGFALSTGSLGLLAIKLQHKYESKKKIQQELEDHL